MEGLRIGWQLSNRYRQSTRGHIRWADGAWSLLVLIAADVTACGLSESFGFIVRSPTGGEGHRLILLGSMAFAGSAVWARLKGRPIWASVLTALPAVVVGGLSTELPDGLYAHLAGLFLIPGALSTMPAELLIPRVSPRTGLNPRGAGVTSPVELDCFRAKVRPAGRVSRTQA